jgi:hypothetical protein
MGGGMSKFFSYPGSSPRSATRKSTGSASEDLIAELREAGQQRNPMAEEFYANRSPTSHRSSGLEPENDSRQGNIMFRGEPARVVHEEQDAHSGQVHTTIARSTRLGSGTTRVTWEPDGARRIVVIDSKPTTD